MQNTERKWESSDRGIQAKTLVHDGTGLNTTAEQNILLWADAHRQQRARERVRLHMCTEAQQPKEWETNKNQKRKTGKGTAAIPLFFCLSLAQINVSLPLRPCSLLFPPHSFSRQLPTFTDGGRRKNKLYFAVIVYLSTKHSRRKSLDTYFDSIALNLEIHAHCIHSQYTSFYTSFDLYE